MSALRITESGEYSMSSVGYGALGSPTREPYNFRLEWAQALFFGSYEVRLYITGKGFWALGSPTREPYNFRLEWAQAIFFGSYEGRLCAGYGVLGPELPPAWEP